jgi:Flp pilus assembly pilin Flp
MAIFVANLWRNRRGQDLTEYALIAGLVASTAVATVPGMLSISAHLVQVLQTAAQVAMHAASLE